MRVRVRVRLRVRTLCRSMLALKACAKGVAVLFGSIGASSLSSGFQCSSHSHSRLGQLGTSMLQLETHLVRVRVRVRVRVS